MRHDIPAPATGSVWIHSAGIGQEVSEGSTLLVMESMKMEMPILSPVDGTVIELAAVGTVVEEGHVVAIVESK